MFARSSGGFSSTPGSSRFGGAAGRPATYYIGSADLRRRNLDRRVEAMIPVADAVAVAQLEQIIELNLSDDTQSWSLDAGGQMASGAHRARNGHTGLSGKGGLGAECRARRDPKESRRSLVR